MSNFRQRNPDLLPWAEPAEDRRRLRLANLLTFGLLLSVFLAALLVELPEPEREELEKVPPRLARMILEKEPPVQPPAPKTVTAPEPEPKPKAVSKVQPPPEALNPRQAPKPAPKPAPVVSKPKPTQEQIQQAREKASQSGVLAMKKSLESLKGLASVETLKAQKLEQTTGNESTRSEQDLIETRAAEGSGGIELSQVEKPDRQALSGRQTTAVEAPADAAEAATVAETKAGLRTREEIALVFDRNKDSFYALYRRALRKNLGLAGDVVFDLTIAPSGKVSAVAIRSSGIDDQALTRKLLARIRLFDFGAKDVAPWQGSYTVTFSPAG